MGDVAVDREISACWIRISNTENGHCIEPEESAADLQPSSSSVTIASTDTRTTQDAEHKHERKSKIRRCVEWILIGMAITAVWMLIVGLPIVLYQLPQEQAVQHSRDNSSRNTSNMNSTTCQKDFYLDKVGYCRPHCRRWKAYPQMTQTVSDAFIIMSAAGGIIAAIIVITLAYLHHKTVFKFPSVFIIYQSITVTVYAILILIGYTAKEALFCSSDDVNETLDKPNSFCNLIGTVSYYTVLQLALWAVFHVVVVFLAVVFPLYNRKLNVSGKMKYIHITMVLLGLILPCVPVAVTFGTGGFSPRDTRFPPIICLGRDRGATVYSLTIAESVIIATGISLLIIVFRKIIKVYGFKLQKSKGAEVRVLIVFCYYAIVGASALIAFNITSQKLQSFSSELDAYFLCERGGIGQNCTFERSRFESLTNPALQTIAFILVGIYPAINLVYVIHIADLKSLKQKICSLSHN